MKCDISAAIACDTSTANVSATTMIDLSYNGLLGESAQTHALKGTWAMRL